MISCKRAAELILQLLEAPLGKRQRLWLWLHLIACRMCRRFRRQAELLDQAGCRLGQEGLSFETQLPELSSDAFRRIEEALRQHPDHRAGGWQ